MTTRLSLFNSPLLLGFDHFERTLDRVSKASADGYPPYNIEQVGPDQLRITVAVADGIFTLVQAIGLAKGWISDAAA